jgi:hypothetical protein
MGSQAHPQFPALVADIQRNFPRASVSADTASEPLMVVVAVDRTRVRDFISSADLAERGETYLKFLDRLLRQLIDGQPATGDAQPGHGDDQGGPGVRH